MSDQGQATVTVAGLQVALEGAGEAAAAAYLPVAVVEAKGDLIAATGPGVVARLPAGADGQVLTAASAEPAGITWAAAASGGGPGPLDAVLQADFPFSSTAMADVTGLAVTVTEAGTYLLSGHLFYDGNSAADMHLAFTAPPSTSMRWGAEPVHTVLVPPVSTPGGPLIVGTASDSGQRLCLLVGTVHITTPGVLQLRAAQGSATGTSHLFTDSAFTLRPLATP